MYVMLLKKYFGGFIGVAIMAAGLNLFLVPLGIAPGGVSGIAIVANYLWRVPVGLGILILNIPIFLWGLRYFSKGFLLRSLVGMVMLAVLTDIFSFMPLVTEDIILASVYGGVFMGLGIGIVFRCDMTTGGADIAAQCLKKKFPEFSVGRFILLIDALVVIIAGIVYGRWETVLYSAVAMYVSSYVIDLLTEGVDFAKLVYVISDRAKDISDAISKELERGTTTLFGSSFYSKNEKYVLLCVVKKYEIESLKTIIKDIDKGAFIIISEVREVLGNNFKEIM